MTQVNFSIKGFYIIPFIMFSCFSFGQEKQLHEHAEDCNHEVIDKNPVYILKGNGYDNTSGKNEMIFSGMTIEGINSGEVSLNDNEVTVGKDGIYRISLSTTLTEEELQHKLVNYSVNLNRKEVFDTNYYTFPLSGIYSFQIQLKQGDKLSFNIIKSRESEDNTFANTLKIQFTDPALITYSEEH